MVESTCDQVFAGNSVEFEAYTGANSSEVPNLDHVLACNISFDITTAIDEDVRGKYLTSAEAHERFSQKTDT